jgi:hypothetical protein
MNGELIEERRRWDTYWAKCANNAFHSIRTYPKLGSHAAYAQQDRGMESGSRLTRAIAVCGRTADEQQLNAAWTLRSGQSPQAGIGKKGSPHVARPVTTLPNECEWVLALKSRKHWTRSPRLPDVRMRHGRARCGTVRVIGPIFTLYLPPLSRLRLVRLGHYLRNNP